MLQGHHISKSYGIHTVLDTITFSIEPNDRVGLIGANGCGKSTLLRILVGEDIPDAGKVISIPKDRIGYLPQGIETETSCTVEAYILGGNIPLAKAQFDLERFSVKVTSDTDEELLNAFGNAQHLFEILGGYQFASKAHTVLCNLGLQDVHLEDRLDTLSSGQRARVGLARILCAEPELLILDEPTNHLDIKALEWLEAFLDDYAGAVLVVSHDRRFLDKTVNRILELDMETHALKEYQGTYSDYQKEKASELEKQWVLWKDQQTEIQRIQRDIYATKEKSLYTERKTKHDHYRRRAKKVAKRAKSKEKRLQKYLDHSDRVERPKNEGNIELEFTPQVRSGQSVLRIENVSKIFGEKHIFEDVDLELLAGERIALVGPNGAGKTTLLRLVMGEEMPSGGTIKLGENVKIGYMPQNQEILDLSSNAVEMIRASVSMPESEVFNFLHYFLIFNDKARQPIKDLSYGERSRLMLARLVVSGANFLILDEPINHLDIPSRLQFETALNGYKGTVLISVHDRAFIEDFATSTWQIDDKKVTKKVLKVQW